MSDAVEQMGCIRHKETARYFTYYEDYQEISKKHPDKLAALLRVLEVKTNKKLIAYESLMEDSVLNGKPLPELNLWLEVSYNDFVYWSLKTMGRSSFQIADKEAEKMLLTKSRVLKRHIRPNDPDSPEVQYKEYLLVTENVQALIDGKELPITGEAYELYGTTPPVVENIPLLKKTWGMLQKTREGLLKKTYPPVENNRLINNNKDNLENKNCNVDSDVVSTTTSNVVESDDSTHTHPFSEEIPPSVAPQVPETEDQPKTTTKKGRNTGKRKPKQPDIDETTQKRIDHVYAFFNKLGQEAIEDETFTYSKTEKDTNAIIAWLKENPTEPILREVYFELWNTEKDPRTGFDWKANMRIHSVLNQYKTRSMAIIKRRKQQAARHIVQAATTPQVPKYQIVEENNSDELEYIGPASARRNTTNKKAGA